MAVWLFFFNNKLHLTYGCLVVSFFYYYYCFSILSPSTRRWRHTFPLEENLSQEILLVSPRFVPVAPLPTTRPSHDKSPHHERCSHPAPALQSRQLRETRRTLDAQRRLALPWPSTTAANGAEPQPVAIKHGYKRRQLNKFLGLISKFLGFPSHLELKLKATRLHNGENLKPKGCTTKPKG